MKQPKLTNTPLAVAILITAMINLALIIYLVIL
jgi:hypothetical protein